MTVKHSLLAILTLGPAYGLQLRDELVRRTPHRAGINVGQVYGTLERLLRADLIVEAQLTDDNLQLYSLTPHGHEAAAEWMSRPAQTVWLDWTEMLDQVLMVSSIPEGPSERLMNDYRDALTRPHDGSPGSQTQREALDFATTVMRDAALLWLDEMSRTLRPSSSGYGLSPLRPRRGRRTTES